MRLPPPQAVPADIVAYVDALEDECYRDPNRAAWQRNKQRWLDLYTGNHFADPLVSTGIAAQSLEPEQLSSRARSDSICRIVYNRVMNAVLAMLAGQISNPPKVVFGARENGEPPIYYINGFIQNPALAPIAAMAGAADDRVQQLMQIYGDGHPEVQQLAIQAGQSIPLPPPLVDQVKMLIDQGKMMTAQARMQGMPAPMGIVPPEALVEITDQTTAQFTQTVFDALWEQCGGIEATTENILNKKVLGWQPTLFEADRNKIAAGECPITLTNVEGTQVFYDPMTNSYRPARYVIMKEPVSLEEGIAKYPDLEPILTEKARSGTLNYLARDGTQTGRLFYLEYARDMCVVRTLWIRDWAYLMDPDEALEKGRIQIGQVPIEQPANPHPAADTNSGIVQNDSGISGQPSPDAGNPVGAGNSGALSPTDPAQAEQPGTGQPEISQQFGIQPPSPPQARQAFLRTDTGEEVNPDHPSWPVIYAIREIRDIEGEVVWDRRCRSPMPVVNNINIPIPFSPYGYGEPDRLDGLQMAINRVLSDLVTHHRYNTYPPQVTRREVANGLSEQLRKMRLQPNAVIIADRDVADSVQGDLSKLVQFIETPPMSNDAWKLLEFLVDAIDKEANNTDVQQGAAPQGSSGAWVANLQAAAAQVAQVTSQATEAWLKQIVRLFVDFIAREMTDQDVMKYCTKYPPAIAEAFRRRQKALYLDITVEIQSGSAAAKQSQTNAMIAAKQAGMTISEPDILERMNIDPDATLKREAEWMQKKADSGLVDQQAEEAATGANNQPKAESRSNAA